MAKFNGHGDLFLAASAMEGDVLGDAFGIDVCNYQVGGKAEQGASRIFYHLEDSGARSSLVVILGDGDADDTVL